MHYAGYPAAVDRLRELCDARGVALVEDAAHSPSAELDGRKLGTWGAAGCFSFFSNKVLSVGEGGLLATDDDGVAERVRSLRSHGMTSGTWDRHRGHAETYDIVDLGFNYRMDEPRAALLLSRMRRVDDEIARRRALVRGYRERLAGVERMTLPYTDDDVEPLVLLRDADAARRGRRPARVPAGAFRARDPDEHPLPGDPRVHRVPAAATRTCRCRARRTWRAPRSRCRSSRT